VKHRLLDSMRSTPQANACVNGATDLRERSLSPILGYGHDNRWNVIQRPLLAAPHNEYPRISCCLTCRRYYEKQATRNRECIGSAISTQTSTLAERLIALTFRARGRHVEPFVRVQRGKAVYDRRQVPAVDAGSAA
jgi:hypothetical protein